MQITGNEIFEKFSEAFMTELLVIHEYVAEIPAIKAELIDVGDRLTSLENEVREHSFILRNYGDQLDDHGRKLDGHGRMIDEHGKKLDDHGRILNEHTKDLAWIKQRLATNTN